MRPVRALSRAALGLLLALAASGCADDEPLGEAPVCGSDTRVTFTGSAGSAPVISWTPRCRAQSLTVWPNGMPTTTGPRWAITSAPASDGPSSVNELLPPVTYGVVPKGARELAPRPALEPGASYAAVVTVADDRGGLRAYGSDPFVAPAATR